MVCSHGIWSARALLLLIFRFIDEIVDVYVILTSFSSLEQEFRTLISRLTITLEAYALQGQELGKVVEGSANSHGPIKEAIFADTVGDVGEPLLLFPDPVVGEDRRNEANLNAVWKLTAFLRTYLPSFVCHGPNSNP